MGVGRRVWPVPHSLKYQVGFPYGVERPGLAWEREHSYRRLVRWMYATGKHAKAQSVAVDEGQTKTIQRGERVDGAATAGVASKRAPF